MRRPSHDSDDIDGHTRDGRAHIVLLGLMGSGKTTVGLRVAKELGRPFVDNDSMVALATGDTPHELAERQGIERLHDEEAAAARRVMAMRRPVVYAGAASLVERLTDRDLVAAWTVWLDVSVEELARRVADDDPRPGLDSSPLETLERQRRQRSPVGSRLADLVVDAEAASPTDIADQICTHWRQRAAPPPHRAAGA